MSNEKKHTQLKKPRMFFLLICAIFSAASAILSQMAVPIGPIPITLTHVSIFLSAGLLGAKYGALSQIIFILLGAVGLPVFSGFSGGFSVLVGSRGGFIIGYITCSLLAGWITQKFGYSMKIAAIGFTCGLLTTYLLGIIWYIFITNTNLVSAFFICVLPFLPGDAFKIFLCAAVLKRLRIKIIN